MILLWVKENQNLASKIMGANFLLMALVLMFWSPSEDISRENQKASANIERMQVQASVNLEDEKSSASNIMQEYKQTQKVQLRVFLVFMLVCGTGLLAYGFVRKEKEE